MAVYTEGPAEYAEVSSTLCRSAQQSPSPYATATLIGNSKIISNEIQRFNNMFYATDIYPRNTTTTTAVQQNLNNNNNNNSNYNRSIHSESYCNPNNSNKVNIVENRMANTMMFSHHDDISNKRNRLRLPKPQNFHINLGSQGEQLYVKVGDLKEGQQIQPQVQSYTWNPQMQNFNIYENHLHRQAEHPQQHNHHKELNAHETDTLSQKTLNCD